MRRRLPRFESDNFSRNLTLVARLEEMAQRKSRVSGRACTPAQLALAWLLAKGEDIVPIPGTKRRKYLEENLGASVVSLTKEEMATLDEAGAPGKVSGVRYGPVQQATIDR